MTAIRIDGKALALKVRAEVAEDVRAFGEPVCLATILVGDDPASHVYVGSKHKASHEAGIDSRDHRFPSDTPESDILDLLAELNADDAVDGILVQLPLPEYMDEPKVLRSVDPAKDVDCFHPQNAGLHFLGEPFLVPATPSGVMVMLAEHGVELKGKEAVVIGPTPPGTGVMRPATSKTEGSTSPTRPALVRLTPTSITVAPDFTISGVTIPGRPTAATRMSALRVCSARFAVRE